jgi:hypothetical protein
VWHRSRPTRRLLAGQDFQTSKQNIYCERLTLPPPQTTD